MCTYVPVHEYIIMFACRALYLIQRLSFIGRFFNYVQQLQLLYDDTYDDVLGDLYKNMDSYDQHLVSYNVEVWWVGLVGER